MIINDEVDDQTRRKFLEKIFNSANRLDTLISDLLNTARIEGGIQLDIAEASPNSFVKKIIEELEQPAKKKGVQLAYHNKTPDGFRAHFDASRLHESIYNLIDNAIKYTPEGSVTVTLESADSHWRCTVTDTGIGIRKEDIPHLFQKFYRSDNAQEAASGTGLGLYVVQKIVAEHGGSVEVQSDGLGKGTTFIVSIPINASDTQHQTNSQPGKL